MVMSGLNAISTVQWHFDFDGTLFFTHDALLSAYEESIEAFGGEFSLEAREALIRGDSYISFLKLCSWKYGEPDSAMLRAHKNRIYLARLDLIRPNYPLIAAAISFFPNVSIVTSSSKEVVASVLSFFDLSQWFPNITTSDDVRKIKPEPHPYLESIAKSPGTHHIAVEDSLVGATSARAAGLCVLMVSELFSEQPPKP